MAKNVVKEIRKTTRQGGGWNFKWTTGANLSVEFSYQVRGTASDVDAKNTKKLVDKANTGGLTFA